MRPFLLASDVVKRPTANNWTASRKARSISAHVRRAGLVREGVSGIQSSVVDEQEGVPMKSIHATFGNDVYGTARTSGGFRRKPVIDYLELLYGLWRQFRACRAGEFI